MSDSYLEKAEESELFRKKKNINFDKIFSTSGSAGYNPEKLAKLCTTFDMFIELLGWQDRPLARLTTIITQYQASIGGVYHGDFKDILIAEEIDRKRSERRETTILNNG